MQDVPIPPAAEKLAREMAAWSTIDLRVRRDYPATPDGRTTSDRFRLIEEPGRIRLESAVQPSEHPQATFLGVELRDGGSGWSTFQVQEFGRISRPTIRDRVAPAFQSGGMSMRPEPLRYGYLGEAPLPRVMANARPIGERTIAGRTADGFRLVAGPEWSSPHSESVYWLDRETGVPLRFEDRSRRPPRPDNAPAFTWEATAFEEMGGRWLPTRSEFRTSNPTPDGPAVEVVAHTTIVESVAFGERHPNSTFRPDPAADPYPADIAPAAPAVLLRATYPGSPISSWPTEIGLGLLAVALLLAFLFLRPRWPGLKWVRSAGKKDADFPSI